MRRAFTLEFSISIRHFTLILTVCVQIPATASSLSDILYD